MPRPRYHLFSSTVLGLALGGGRRLRAAWISGFLIDVDHFVDYVTGPRRIILPLHGWELLLLAGAIDRAMRLGGALVGSYLLHLILDQIWNKKRSPLAYFLTYRASRGFREDELGAVDPAQRHVWRRTPLIALVRWF